MRFAVLAMVVAAGTSLALVASRRSSPPCLYAHGACIVFDATFPPDARRYVESRIAPAFDRGAIYWDADPESLRGWVIIFHGYWFLHLPMATIWGWTNLADRRIDVTLQRPLCPELVLVHEFGHAFSYMQGGDGRPHGDNDDPRMEDAPILQVLAGLPGCE